MIRFLQISGNIFLIVYYNYVEEVMTMITELGKEIRKLRIDKGENLSSMSKKLGISISYLSAIENGTRDIPSDFVDKLGEIYHLSKERKEKFVEAEANSINKISIFLHSAICPQRQLAFTLSRKLKDLSPEECEKIMKYLGGNDDK